MALLITNTDNLTDNTTLALNGASGMATATRDGTTYMYVTGSIDHGVSGFSVAPDGTIMHVGSVFDDATLRLNGAGSAATASVGGTSYLFVTGFFDHGVSVFEVGPGGALISVANVGDDATRRLFTAHDVTAAVVGGTTYLFVAGFDDDGVSVFAVGADGQLTDVQSVGDDPGLQLDGAAGVTTAQIGGTTYLFATGAIDNGVSVFRVEADGTLANVENVSDDATLELASATGVTTAQIGSTTYLFVSGGADDGVSVFRVEADGTLVNVDNVSDTAALGLDGAFDMTTARIGQTTYLFVVGRADWAVAVFEVAADGTLTHVTNINDPALELDGALGVAAAVVAGTPHLFASGHTDDGVSVFSLFDDTSPVTIVSDGGGDLATVVVDENTTAVTTVVATDPGSGVPTYSISGGIDAARFQIDSSTGALSFVTTPDFEAPTDAGGDNDYVVEVRASDGNQEDRQTITVTVADVVEQSPPAPPIITSNGGSDAAGVALPENTMAVTMVTAIDPSNTGGLAYAISGGADAPRFAIDPSTGVLSFVTAPDFEAPADADGDNGYLVEVAAVTPNGADHQSLTVTVTDVAETGPRGGPSDILLGDVLWRHRDGTVATARNDFGMVATAWHIGGAGDFDGDRDSDVLFRRDDGALAAWELEQGTLLANHDLGIVGALWQTAGADDFDRDGDSEILWRHRDGHVTTWDMRDMAYEVNRNLPDAAITWQIAGTGDFDRDGDADILWRHRDGQVVMWEMEDGAYVIHHNLPHAADTWQIRGTGDFDHDGDADILWRHRDGAVVTWEMEDGAYVANHNLPAVATTWQIHGARDFDRDGDADILWRHADGDVVTWEMQRGAFVASHHLGTVATDWRIERTGEFDLV